MVDSVDCGLGGQTKRNQWLLYSQRGLRSAHWKACMTSGWLVSSSGVHWITLSVMWELLDHVIDLMVIWGPVEAFLQPVPLLMTLLGAL